VWRTFGAWRTTGVEVVFFVPLGHGEIEMRTLVGQNVGKRLERVGAFLGDHVEEERHTVAAPWIGQDLLLLLHGEVLGGTQWRQDGGDVQRLDQLVTGPLQTQPLARHQRHRHYHASLPPATLHMTTRFSIYLTNIFCMPEKTKRLLFLRSRCICWKLTILPVVGPKQSSQDQVTFMTKPEMNMNLLIARETTQQYGCRSLYVLLKIIVENWQV